MLVYGLYGLLNTGDYSLYNGFKVTIFYAIGTIPFQLSIALFLAYLLFNSLRGKAVLEFFSSYHMLPGYSDGSRIPIDFSSHPLSFANGFLNLLGLDGERWLSESRSIVTLLLEGIGFSNLPTWLDIVFPVWL